MIFLIDQDGVLADWNAKFEQRIVEFAPHIDFPFLKDNANWDMSVGLDAEGRAAIETVMSMPGFYADIDPFPGVSQALNEMGAAGHTVFICTSPYISNPTCASDKLAWLDQHIGRGWAKRAIITSDKTIVHGDILIDDRPDITGDVTPSWEHVIFTAPYNRQVKDARRRLNTLANWKDLL